VPRQGLRSLLLALLALVFTIGLTFATVELPYLIDDLLQNSLTTPGFDSHADVTSQLKTELFIGYYHLRVIGYVCFGFTVVLIIVGFATRKSDLAAIGAFAFMLPVFAQFAGVMFFLAGLGVLNVLWLPLLDISFELQTLGLIIRAPFDLLMWMFRQIGFAAYWPLVYFFIGAGLFIFILGTYAWLSARAQGKAIAMSWIYRLSRHPQYLGWILWSYGLYLLLLQMRYPRRSWGIDASLPWLLSTMIIIGVALLEELNMRRRHGDAYERYRQSAPFLFPVPAILGRVLTSPFRLLFGRSHPQRKREIVVIMALYTALLVGASALFYGGGLRRLTAMVTSAETRDEQMAQIAERIRNHPNWRAKYFLAGQLAEFGESAVAHFIPLLDDPDKNVRVNAAERLGEIGSVRAIPALVTALQDYHEDVRGRALGALAVIGSRDAVEPMMALLDDPVEWVRVTAARSLAALGVSEITDRLIGELDGNLEWVTNAYIGALGTLKAEAAVPALIQKLEHENPGVRRTAVVALMEIGSPAARDALLRATEDSDWEVRVYAAEALRRLAKKR
jgi:protein-S-isoprenylcysteine O-methyltransferase Ste14